MEMVKTATRDYYLPLTAGFLIKFFKDLPDDAVITIDDHYDDYGDRIRVFTAKWTDNE